MKQPDQAPRPACVSVAIGIGSNLGARLEHVRFARDQLSELLAVPRFSRLYETEAMYVTGQPAFLNACCVGKTDLAAPDLLAWLKNVEGRRGRVAGGTRFGPRELDLDILSYGDVVIETPGLQVPHPRLTERAFVLIPLAELLPGWVHPGLGRTVQELAADVSSVGVRLYEPDVRANRGRCEDDR